MNRTLHMRNTCIQRRMPSFLLALFLFSFSTSVAQSRIIPDKTPDDVFYKVMVLSEKIQWLRRDMGVTTPWPSLPEQTNKEPRHVLQKALEVLVKINRYRLIRHMGAIPTSHFSGRDITPNEVFSMVDRLTNEMDILFPVGQRGPHSRPPAISGHTPSQVYTALWEASRALDPVLGIRGFNPSDVYAQSLQVVALIKILRQSQNLSLDMERPELGAGHHPNHALVAVYNLQKRISLAEKALWMPPVEVPDVPHRVITPTEVYDATGTILAELRRILYRLGLERVIEIPLVPQGKTPDDVIQNIVWAEQMMPQFSSDRPLIQSDRALLKKTPNHVFALSEHILKELKAYFKVCKIQFVAHNPPITLRREPRHVYQKALEVIEKTDRVRKLSGLFPSSVPRYPLRAITPTEVFDLVIRLEDALHVIYRQAGMVPISYLSLNTTSMYQGKTPSDVYHNIWKISLLLDAVLEKEVFTPTDIYHEAKTILLQVQVIGKALGRFKHIPVMDKKTGIKSLTVYASADKLLGLVRKAQKRSGMFYPAPPKIPMDGPVSPSQVFNLVRMVQTEMTALKVHLGLTIRGDHPKQFTNKKMMADVLQVLEQAIFAFKNVLITTSGKGQKS